MKYFAGVMAMFVSAFAIAQTQVPNDFQAGTPARADEVNANFSTLESAANQNASDVAANAGDIQTNQAAIQANADNISMQPMSSGLHVYSQGQSIGRFLSSKSASPLSNQFYMISVTGYLFQGRWIDDPGDPYLTAATYYFSDPGCTGTLYIEAGNVQMGSWGSVYRPVYAATAAAFGNYYIPRGSARFSTTTNSRESDIIGGCFDEVLTRFVYQPLPNDEAVTGVPDVEPSLPYTIGVP